MSYKKINKINHYVEAPSNNCIRNPRRSLINGPILLIAVVTLIFMAANYSMAFDSQKLVSTAKRIIMVGVEVGLEEAGSRILGPTAWKYFKIILSPIIDELQNRYPALSFDKPGDTNAHDAAVAAVEHLSNDSQLQRMLLVNFNDLKKGQHDIRAGINELEKKLKAVGEDVKTILQLLRQEVVTTAKALPTWIDVSDLVEESYVLMLAKMERPGAGSLAALLAVGVGKFGFIEIVLEGGKPFTTYRTRIKTPIHFFFGEGLPIYAFEQTIRPAGVYVDDLGRKCREYTFSDQAYYVNGTTSEKTYETKTLCRVKGRWVE